MSTIVLCCPTLKLHTKHQDHLVEFYAKNKFTMPEGAGAALRETLARFLPSPDATEAAAGEIERALQSRFDLRLYRHWYRALHHIQNGAVNFAKSIGASHILFTEDDQWGFPQDGIDELLRQNKDVIGFSTYFKEYPFKPMAAMKKYPTGNLIEDPDARNLVNFVGQGDGPEVQERDLITWAFTLVKMRVFYRMEEAGLQPFRQWGPHPTDSFFCQYCRDLGIPIHVHYGFTIGHGDVDHQDIPEHRRLHEILDLKRRHLRMPAPQTHRDDWGNVYGWDEVRPGVGGGEREPANGNGNSDEIVMYDEQGREMKLS